MWFKFNWFGSKEREELKKLRSEHDQLAESILKKVNTDTEVSERPFKKMYFADGVVTVVLNDGTIRAHTGIDRNTYLIARGSETEKEMLAILNPPVYNPSKVEIESVDEKNLVLANSRVLKENKEFEVKNNNIFLKGVSLPMPASVAASFIEILEKYEQAFEKRSVKMLNELFDRFVALKMFWLKLALNGIESSRNDLLNFIRKNDVRITRNGNLVLYRRIVAMEGTNKKYIEFVSQNYAKIKSWKKSPKDFWVYANEKGDYELHKELNFDYEMEDYVGSLFDCYHSLEKKEENKYTSWHNHGKHIIKIGSIYSIKEKEINLNNGLCAAGGLHAAAVSYNYSGFGDTPVVVLVNPSKAITVPVNETGKLRTTEMFIACINDKDHGVHFDEGALNSFDEEYNNISISELEEAVKTKTFAVASVQDEVSPITFTDLETIKEMLKGRIKNI